MYIIISISESYGISHTEGSPNVPVMVNIYASDYSITPKELLTTQGGSPYELSVIWEDSHDYRTNWFVYNSLQRDEVVGIGRYTYKGKGDSESQTNVVITLEKYYVSYHNGEEYIPKEKRYKVLYSIFNKSSEKGEATRLNLSSDEFSKLDNISTGNVIELDWGGSGKVAKGGIRMLSFGGNAYSIYARAAKTLQKWRKHIRFGVNDNDLLNKGFHIHFDEIKGMELGLKPGKNNEILLHIVGKKKGFSALDLNTDLFNKAMNDRSFQTQLLQRLFDTQMYSIQKADLLKGSIDAKRWLDNAHESNFLIKSLIKDFKF
jgi:hypothetical protein